MRPRPSGVPPFPRFPIPICPASLGARRFPRLLGLALLLAASQPAGAQVMASEKGTVIQTVDGTTITIEYYRPVARGRTPFPDVVHWGRMWTPGANWATTIEVDQPIRLNGNPVSKGKYSIWMIPQVDDWTVILNRDARRFHTQPPASSDEEVRLTVRATTGAHMETLAFYFPVVTRDGATLDMHWGTTVIPLRITVAASRPSDVPARERATYVGRYHLTPNGADTNVPETTLDVTDTGGQLHGRATPALWGYDATFDLVPIGHDGEFRLSFYRDGKLFGMEAEGDLAFRGDSAGHATTIELTQFNQLLAKGSREN
jgi:Protein of unknown function (DUF2911)